MTEIEAKGFIQGKLDCMEKCDVFNREDKHRNNECDNCEYCYSQGTFGEQKEAYQIAINSLEELKAIKEKGRYVQGNKAGQKIGYNKALDDFAGGLDYLLVKYAIENTLEPNINNVKFSLNHIEKIISRVIKQLKAGGNNDA